MRFMVIRKADAMTESGTWPDDAKDMFTAMARYNEELADAGMFVGGEGLQPSSKGARVKFSAGKPRVIDGPFTEAKELIAGFTMIEADSWDEALAWIKRWPAIGSESEVELEVRQVYEASDFPPEIFSEEEAAKEQALRDRVERKGT
jgi:hypothetical protein